MITLRCEGNLQIGVSPAPNPGDAGKPIFAVNGLASVSKLLQPQKPGRAGEIGASDLAAHSAGSNADLRIIADALALAHVAASHDVEPVALFAEPDGRTHSGAILAEGGERDVLVAADLGGDWICHSAIVREARRLKAG